MTENPNPGRITMYTTRWCSDCFRAKHFLGKHHVEYDEIDIAHDDEARAYVEKVNGGYRSVPTIVFPSSKVIVEPSNRELEAVLVSEGLLAAS
ncbi:MAG TPA: glutaredoxin family protein [Candidatus Solibacter sp.]|nr:glutaredoxin family protein [Candidatus Solibacter sp.]